MDEYTNIDEIFKWEIFLIKLCGGFLFEGPIVVCATLRFLIVIVSKYFDYVEQIRYARVIEIFPKASLQNLKIFVASHYLVRNMTLVVMIVTSIRYRCLMRIILKKRFNRIYLSTNRYVAGIIKSSFRDLLDRSSSTGSRDNIDSQLSENYEYRDDRMSASSQEPILKRNQADGISRIKMARNLILFNLLIAIVAGYFRTAVSESILFALDQEKLNKSSVTVTAPIGQSAPGGGSRMVRMLAIDKNQSDIDRIHNYSSHNLQANAGVERYLTVPSLKHLRKISNIFLISPLTATLELNQQYGQFYVVLMIVATITDLIRFSHVHDEDIWPTAERSSMRVSSIKVPKGPARDYVVTLRDSTRSMPNLLRERSLLKTELLVHTRDVLMVVRCIMSLDYLMLLLTDLSRLMSIFCIFNASASVGRLDLVAMICVEYARIAFNMSLTRIGYHWLHAEVNKLNRSVDESNLIDSVNQFDSSSKSTAASQSERMTIFRLADDISTLWPTDWFTPDLKSYLTQNVFVITFVATLQQLVEAGTRVEYRTSTGNIK